MRKLRDLIREFSSGDDELRDALLKYIRARNENNVEAEEQAKGMVAAYLMAKGWSKNYSIPFLNAMQALSDESDVEELIAQQGINEESPIDPVFRYKATIAIPVISKKHIKPEIRNLQSHLRKNNIKVIKVKQNFQTAEFPKLGDEGGDDVTVDLFVDVVFDTKLDRDDLYDVIEPNYELTEIDFGKRLK